MKHSCNELCAFSSFTVVKKREETANHPSFQTPFLLSLSKCERIKTKYRYNFLIKLTFIISYDSSMNLDTSHMGLCYRRSTSANTKHSCYHRKIYHLYRNCSCLQDTPKQTSKLSYLFKGLENHSAIISPSSSCYILSSLN